MKKYIIKRNIHTKTRHSKHLFPIHYQKEQKRNKKATEKQQITGQQTNKNKILSIYEIDLTIKR